MSDIENNLDINDYDDNDFDDDYMTGGGDSDTETETEAEVEAEAEVKPQSESKSEEPKQSKSSVILYNESFDSDNNFYKKYDGKFDKFKLIKNITKYEYTTVISLRAEQVSNNAPTFLTQDQIDDLENINPISIAKKEYELKKIPFIINRPISGDKYESWKLADLY